MSNKDFNMRAYIDIVNEANGMSRYAQRTLNQFKPMVRGIQSATDVLGKMTPEQLQAMNLAAKKPGPIHDALGHPGHNHDEPMDEAAGHTKDHVHTGGDTTGMTRAEIDTMNKRLDKHAPGRGSDEKGGAPYTRGDVTYKHETPGKPGWNIGLTDAKMKEVQARTRRMNNPKDSQ
jgi:hypothetical protein